MNAPAKLPHATALPANDPPQYRTLDALATELGFKHARAMRDWCRSRGVPYHRDGKINWADRNAVLAAIARGPVYVVPAKPAPASVGSWVDATIGGRHG